MKNLVQKSNGLPEGFSPLPAMKPWPVLGPALKEQQIQTESQDESLKHSEA